MSRAERESSIDNLLVRNHLIIVMIRWTGLAPWEFEFLFPGSRTSTFLSLWGMHGGHVGLWFVVCGLMFVVCGLLFVVCGLWFGGQGFGFGARGFGLGFGGLDSGSGFQFRDGVKGLRLRLRVWGLGSGG